MAAVKPLVLSTGTIRELSDSDSLSLPSVAPAFNFDFRNGQQLDSRISFSRNSAVASHFNELGVLKSDTANVPRFNFASGVSKGLLIEKAATNLITTSSSGTWSSSPVGAIATVADQITAPDGTLTADKLQTNDIALNAHLGYKTFSGTPSTVYHVNICVKKGEYRYIRIAFGNTGFGAGPNLYCGVILDVNDGTIKYQTGLYSNPIVTALNDGWYQVQFSVQSTATVGATYTFGIVPCPDSISLTSLTTLYTPAATGLGVYVWGVTITTEPSAAQITTTGTSVTRALDLATVTGSNFNYWRADEYSCLAVFTGQAYGDCYYNDFNDGTANERIYLESISGTLTLKIVDGGVEQCSLALGTIVTGTEYRVAVAIKLNDIAASINGATIVTDTSATLPTVTQHNIGSNYAGANQANAEIAKITGWASRLTNTQLEALSA